jgi:hypothetical protein
MPMNEAVPTWFFPAVVDTRRGKLVADFGNALPTTRSGGPIVPTLQLEIGTLAIDGSFSSFWRVPIGGRGWYGETAAICEFPRDRKLTAVEMQRLQSTPIAVRQQSDGSQDIIDQEGSDGLHVRAEAFVYRISAENQSKLPCERAALASPLQALRSQYSLTIRGCRDAHEGAPCVWYQLPFNGDH